MNTETPNQVSENEPSRPLPADSRMLRWHRRVLGFCLVIFALELGLFLLAFPWRPEWEMSWIPVHSKRLAPIWMSPYFRGVVSGLGLLNLGVAFAELGRQIQFFRRPRP